MDDLISREAAIKALSHGEGCGHVCRNAIKRIPSVEAIPLEPIEPQKQIEQREWIVCGNCKNHLIHKWKYCPNCGHEVKWE